MGELVGAALLLGAPFAGTIATIGFAFVLRRRIAIEERALARGKP
jgi:isoprenylcysteine carboxyl methyltransferase (ICMT) family protein YpbQ